MSRFKNKTLICVLSKIRNFIANVKPLVWYPTLSLFSRVGQHHNY